MSAEIWRHGRPISTQARDGMTRDLAERPAVQAIE
jgi:hypothetical protein